MRSTLFYVPHEIAGIPLFGFGLLLGLLAVGFFAWGAWLVAKKRSQDESPAQELFGAIPFVAIAGAIIVFLLPRVESTWPDGTPIGLPVRGYGVFVLLGLLSGIGITVHRARRFGIDADTIIGLGFWMMATGVVGARAFYVIQKWSEFKSFAEIFQITEGGLVIYGGVIGGIVAGTVYCLRRRLKISAMADLIAPGFLIGLAFGRIGCLLHGCCFGGVCDVELPAITFPQGSAPYVSQLVTGRVLGIHTDPSDRSHRITQVDAASPAAKSGVEVGERLSQVAFDEVEREPGTDPTAPMQLYAEATVGGRVLRFMPDELPERSQATHPSQIYSSVNALLLCLLIWFLQPAASRDGIAFCVAIILYALSRFILEGVRSDEAQQLGTGFTISQLIALASVLLAVASLAVIFRSPKGRIWDWSAV